MRAALLELRGCGGSWKQMDKSEPAGHIRRGLRSAARNVASPQAIADMREALRLDPTHDGAKHGLVSLGAGR
jgi:hypothetical protein